VRARLAFFRFIGSSGTPAVPVPGRHWLLVLSNRRAQPPIQLELELNQEARSRWQPMRYAVRSAGTGTGTAVARPPRQAAEAV
jgi:hypothetical protein